MIYIHFSALGQTDLSRVRVTGVRTAYDKYQNISESKGVKAHFQLDENCLLVIDRVRFIAKVYFAKKFPLDFRLNLFFKEKVINRIQIIQQIKSKNQHYQVNIKEYYIFLFISLIIRTR
jgi:hypothetical protein